MKIIRFIIAILFFILFSVVVALASVVTLSRWNIGLSSPVLRFGGRTTLRILNVPLIVEGDWHIKDEICRVCICNHQSTLDIIWFSAVCPPRLGGVGKKELKWVPLLNVMWWVLKLYYVDRSDSQKARATFEHIASDIQKTKRSFTLAPEGTRSADGRLGAFKKGAFHLALQANVPILPVIVAGAHEAMPKGSFSYNYHPIHIRFLEPIDTSTWEYETLNDHVQDTRAIVKKAYDQLRSDIGLPPL